MKKARRIFPRAFFVVYNPLETFWRISQPSQT